MNNQILNNLIATGKAQFGTYVQSGGLCVLRVPEGKGIVITHMRLYAFADLDPGLTFSSNRDEVIKFFWHQLRVIGDGTINAFHARHNPVMVVDRAGNQCLIPYGWHDWDVFLSYEQNVIFELSHLGKFNDGMINVTNPLTGNVKVPLNPQPPFGYGRAGVGGSIPVVEQYTNGTWRTRQFNTFTPANPPGSNSGTQFIWPVIAGITSLNPPQWGVFPFGNLTAPILEVRYVVFNKQPDWTFSKPI